MTSTASTEKHAFQAEISQLLDIVIHSLYTDREIFVRELISNAADASEKLRYLEASGEELLDKGAPLTISITTDKEAKTITFADRGIGMTKDELVQNLGTIAHSGSKGFMQTLKERAEGGSADAGNLIGQFGVGFYSAFMVADRVVVRSRSGRPDGGAWLWQSDGRTGYEIEPAEKEGRGTEITLHLKEEEFADTWKIESIIRKYSNFVPFPIELGGKVVNTVQAVWTRSPKEVTDAEYEEFYKFACHDHEAPAYRLHFNSDAPLNLRALLFVPAKSMELMTLTREESAVGLYCRRVMITGKASGLLPEWLRFVRGVVDSEDLPLNISRETMQDSSLVRKLNDVLTKRFIKFLDEAAREDSERYANFYAEHGHCLREGAASDWQHKEALAKLLRFASTAVEAGKLTGFADYTGRMKEGQEDIYWMSAPTADSAKASPYFEAFDAKGWEVLVLTDPRDEFLMQNLGTVEGKKLVSVERAKLSLDPKDGEKLTETEGAELTQFVKTVLGSRVGEVRVSSRLVGSPAIVVEKEGGLSPQMRRMLKAMRRDDAMSDLEDPVADLELNPANPVIVGLHRMRETETALATQLAEQLLDQALVSANLLEDPRAMLQRMNALLERLVKR